MEAVDKLMMELKERLALGFDAAPLSEQEREQQKADSYNVTVGTLHEVDGYNCDRCKNKGYIAKVVLNEMFGYFYEVVEPCKCQRVREAIRRLNRSGLKNVVKEYTFDKYETIEPWQRQVKDTALRFCAEPGGGWLFVGGQSGAGKSHICTAVAVNLIKQGKEARYMLWRDDINRIKAVANEPEEYARLVKPLKEVEVLYIDDLFKSGKGDDGFYKPPTAADINAAFEILNYRYNNPELMTIISSERTLSEIADIDEAIGGRIAEKSKANGFCINIKRDRARNWRLKGVDEI